MSKRYTVALKLKMVDRMRGVNGVSGAQLSRETGITQQSLSRWLNSARSLPSGAFGNEVVSSWTAEQKARILAQAGSLVGDELARYLEGEGVRLDHFRRWRTALEEAGEESVGLAKRIGKLERELARKERALAQATTFLLLRESLESSDDKDADEQVHSMVRYFLSGSP
jgi:transposase